MTAVNHLPTTFRGWPPLTKTQVAKDSEQALDEVSKLLNIGTQFKLFEVYQKSLSLDPDTLGNFFDTLVELTLCTAKAIKHFRRNPPDSFLSPNTWGNVESDFKTNLETLTGKLHELKTLAEAANTVKLNRTSADLVQHIDSLKLTKMGSSIAVSCVTVPHQRNSAFYGRQGELEEISLAFEQQQQSANTRIGTVAIWGTGGIGKSQIALEYSYQQWDWGTAVVLWIASETDAEIAKSFSEAAYKMDLDGYSETNTPDKNRDLVLLWLQNIFTGRPPVFDNVEEMEALEANIPRVSQSEGKVLITCRNEFLAESAAMSSVEIPSFLTEESAALMLQILKKPNAMPEEVEAARSLSEQLGGLALAIDIIAKNIKVSRKFKTVTDFLSYSFETPKPTINPDATRLMEVLCFLGPEGNPQDMLQDQFIKSSKEWQEEARFEDAKLHLTELSLTELNGDTGLMSIHRLIQFAYLERMSPEPQRSAHTHLYTKWMRNNNPAEQSADYRQLVRDDAWYMLEIQHFTEAESLLLSLLPECEEESTEKVDLLRDLMGIYERTGRSTQAVKYAKKELDLLLRLGVNEDNDLANAHSDMGYSLCSAFQASEALPYLDKAIEIAKSHPESDRYTKFNIDRFLRNHGRMHGKNSHYDGE
ncbi:hypothetical protein ACHAPT_010972 [Fusarium lateritium]